jgi:hypothetical protein
MKERLTHIFKIEKEWIKHIPEDYILKKSKKTSILAEKVKKSYFVLKHID